MFTSFFASAAAETDDDTNNDVRGVLIKLLDSDKKSIVVNNGTMGGGDPWPGMPKQLIVRFNDATHKWSERDDLDLDRLRKDLQPPAAAAAAGVSGDITASGNASGNELTATYGSDPAETDDDTTNKDVRGVRI